MEAEHGDSKTLEDGAVGDNDFHDDHEDAIVENEEGVKVSMSDSDSGRIRKLDVVPVFEGSVSVASSSGSHRSKLRLCVEMNIKSKATSGRDVPDDADKCSNGDPVTVVIDYPDDVVVAVNAKIQRLDSREVSTPEEADNDHAQKSWHNDDDVFTDQNDNKVLNSTFVKLPPEPLVPLSSTLIYPIIEEVESNDAGEKGADKSKEQNQSDGIRSGDASLYQTVMGDDGAVGFGNISVIAKVDSENQEIASKDQLSSNNINFGKNPSKKLNSSSMLFKSDKMTPGEKLVKALHILARYRGVWGIYENEDLIVTHLVNLNRLLATTDKATVYSICREDDYLEVRGLISYFTLENRFIIRSELLQTFTLLSQKSEAISSFISASDIPIVLAREVGTGDFRSTETYAYAQYLLQIIGTTQLTENQCGKIHEKFYGSLCAMIVKADKNYLRAMSEILFEILLHYHEQLGETDLKWQSLYSAAKNLTVMKKIKQKMTNFLLNDASLSPRSEGNQMNGSGEKIKEILIVINDLIICNESRNLFTNAELDLILVTLIHKLENGQFTEFHRDALKTIHRILLAIKTEPSGLDKLERIVARLLKEAQGPGDYDRCYRGVLKKIYKIIT